MKQSLLSDTLWLRIIIGMVLGIITGFVIAPDGLNLLPPSFFNFIMPWLALPGQLFLGLLKMIIVPLVLSSVILGVASAGTIKSLKIMGGRIVPYFIATTAIAVTIGILLVSIIQPGENIATPAADMSMPHMASPGTMDNLTIPDRIMNMVPVNPSEAALNKNMLQLVVLGILIGIALLVIKSPPTQSFRSLCDFVQEACMMIVGWAMWMAPVAVFSLMIVAMTSMGLKTLSGMGLYMLCVILGLLCILGVYMAIVTFLAGRQPLQFLKDIRAAQVVAFSTSSSAATMPVSLTVAEEKLKTHEDVHDFVIPLGATINMDGTAMYQAVAAIFLCQAFGIDLSFGETILLLLTTIGASIGTPAMPGVGIVVLATILSGIGVPPAGIGIILGVDRILDMCRTTVNVTGDLTATAVMQKWMHGKEIGHRQEMV